MKNMSNSLLTKVLAYLLITITALTFTVAVTSSVLIKTYDIDRNPDMAFFKSSICSDITTDYAMDVYNGYFTQYISAYPDEQALEDYMQYYSEENTNFFFEITDNSGKIILSSYTCLLYTSDAADDLLCVDLGGRRIIKKKKTHIDLTKPNNTTHTQNIINQSLR